MLNLRKPAVCFAFSRQTTVVWAPVFEQLLYDFSWSETNTLYMKACLNTSENSENFAPHLGEDIFQCFISWVRFVSFRIYKSLYSVYSASSPQIWFKNFSVRIDMHLHFHVLIVRLLDCYLRFSLLHYLSVDNKFLKSCFTRSWFLFYKRIYFFPQVCRSIKFHWQVIHTIAVKTVCFRTLVRIWVTSVLRGNRWIAMPASEKMQSTWCSPLNTQNIFWSSSHIMSVKCFLFKCLYFS